MEFDFDFVPTDKLRGRWGQEFAIVRNNTIYLRIVGGNSNYRLMTATADEPAYPQYALCPDKECLWTAAALVADAHNLKADENYDFAGRRYISPFTIVHREGATDVDFLMYVKGIIDEFFAVYDDMAKQKADKVHPSDLR